MFDSTIQTAGLSVTRCVFAELNIPFPHQASQGPALSASGCSGLPTVFMGSSQGFDHKALAIIETVSKVLVSAGFEVLRSLSGICCGICQGRTQRNTVSSAFGHHQLLSLA